MNLTFTDFSIYLDPKNSLSNLAKSFHSETSLWNGWWKMPSEVCENGKILSWRFRAFPWTLSQLRALAALGFLSLSQHLHRNKHILAKKKKKGVGWDGGGGDGKKKTRCLWEAMLTCTSILRHSMRWQGSGSAGHYSRQPEPLQKLFFSYRNFHHR